MRDEMTLSDVEPELGAIDAYQTHDEPPFPLVIRGYERRSVDEYLELTAVRLAELEALQSPSLAVKEALERVADDTGGILKEAHETADGVLQRAREEADRLVNEAREEADRTIASAEARVRQIGIDTDALWQERLRLIEDAQAVSASLAQIADEAAARFPAWEDADDTGVVAAEPLDDQPIEEIVEQPTEAFDVAEMLAAEEEAEAVEAEEPAAMEDERPLPDGLDELEPPPEFR
jgi:cell division septum initiation protein DivIVA